MSDNKRELVEIENGFQTAFIDSTLNSNLAYRAEFIANDHTQGTKVLSTLENELKNCDEFYISVAFITMGGITPLLQTLKELEDRKIPGKILTTNYLTFNDPKALIKLSEFKNIKIKMFYLDDDNMGFHTKGYMFRKDDIYRMVVGSSNLTMTALTLNKEWNTKLVASVNGEYTSKILDEFNKMWNQAQYLEECIDIYSKIYFQKKEFLKNISIPTIQQYKLSPNSMQLDFIRNINQLITNGEKKGLLISATGTGKTYASAFALRDIAPQKVLFLVHREQIAKQAYKSFKNVFGESKTFGVLSGNVKDYDADYIFSTMQTMAKQEVLEKFSRIEFDVIIIDEVHRAGAESYKRIMSYFTPGFWLGMTASPDRTDGFDIYKLFDHNIAMEIRLQQAMEENLLCPFHYFGITDLLIEDNNYDDLKEFNQLTSDDRVRYVIEKAQYFGYSGDRVKGLVFCSTKNEAKLLSEKFNKNGFKTAFLSGDDKQEDREDAIEKLVTNEADYLDYIFTVDIFNEGVDIPEVNQVIMLRPTESPIVFIQQLGRGLRKSEGKEYVVILDFIGNYTNNFMIPIALSGDRSYNKDTIRRYLSDESRVIPGSSSIHFDEISKKRIFASIDASKPNTIKFLKEEYLKLKNKLGRIPNYIDFENYGAIDISLFFENSNLGSYHEFLKKYDEDYKISLSEIQEEMLVFISGKIANGKRVEELDLLKRLIAYHQGVSGTEEIKEWTRKYKNSNAIKVLTNDFVTSEVNKRKFQNSIFINEKDGNIEISDKFRKELSQEEFIKSLSELVEYGFRNNKLYYKHSYKDTDFVLYQKYTYEDVCKLLNWTTNIVAQNIGGYKFDEETNTFPVFINYNKDENINASIRYEDRFLDESTLIALSKQPRTPESKDVKQIYQADVNGTKIYLFVRKNKDDSISKEFYFLGEIHAKGKPVPIVMKNTDKKAVEIMYHLDVPVREDIYEYLIS